MAPRIRGHSSPSMQQIICCRKMQLLANQPPRSSDMHTQFYPHSDCYAFSSPDTTGHASIINLQFTDSSQQLCIVCFAASRSASPFTLTFHVTQIALHQSCELAAARCRYVGPPAPSRGRSSSVLCLCHDSGMPLYQARPISM